MTFGGLEIEGIQSWGPSRQNKISPVSIPRRHGALVPQVAFSDFLRIVLKGEVWRDTSTDLRDYFDTLGAKLFNVGTDKLTFLDDGRYVNAICTGTAFAERDATRAPAYRGGFSLEFACGDPFFYAATEEEDNQNAIATSPYAYTITNNGPVRTPVRVEITAVGGTKTDVKLTNSTTGLYMRYLGTIALNGKVVMNSKENAQSCQNGGSNDLNNFEGGFWMLEPGVNNITYTGPTSVNVKVLWTKRYIN